MTLPWKKGPPPEGEAGSWLVWCGEDAERVAYRINPSWKLEVVTSHEPPASGWEASITHHLPEKITPPGEAPAAASPREGGEGNGAEELYEALERLIEAVDDGEGSVMAPRAADVSKARAALARARGEGT